MVRCRRLLACFSWTDFSPIIVSTIVLVLFCCPTFLCKTLSAQEVEHFPPRGVAVGLGDDSFIPRNPARSPVSSLGVSPPPANPGLPTDVFQQLVQHAGMIFAGRVTSVGGDGVRLGEGHPATAVTVTFQVEHALRGTSANQSVTIHEWAGLWGRGERYRVGEHVLLFLYGPSGLGLTSPVAGPLGRFALDSQDRIVMSAGHVAAYGGNPILRGKPLVPYVDFALAVRNARPGRWMQP